jgi:hypothetical protein
VASLEASRAGMGAGQVRIASQHRSDVGPFRVASPSDGQEPGRE